MNGVDRFRMWQIFAMEFVYRWFYSSDCAEHGAEMHDQVLANSAHLFVE